MTLLFDVTRVDLMVDHITQTARLNSCIRPAKRTQISVHALDL